jgi:hypothetical protein
LFCFQERNALKTKTGFPFQLIKKKKKRERGDAIVYDRYFSKKIANKKMKLCYSQPWHPVRQVSTATCVSAIVYAWVCDCNNPVWP